MHALALTRPRAARCRRPTISVRFKVSGVSKFAIALAPMCGTMKSGEPISCGWLLGHVEKWES